MNGRTRLIWIPAAAAALLVGCGGGTNDKVGLIGDSITDLSRQPLQQALGSDHRVEIVGKFGARADQVVEDVKVIAASHPAAAIVNIGTNDAIQQVPPEQSAATIQTILDELDGVGCRYLVEINDGITDKASGASRQAEATALNEQLKQLADKNRIELIPWNQVIRDNGGNGAITFDTVHLSTKGVLLLASTYRDALDNC